MLKDPLPSSELMPIDSSSDSRESQTPSPAKPPPAPPVHQHQPKKVKPEPSKRKIVHIVEEESEMESRPKRQKPLSSDSSIEIDEVQSPPKAPHGQSTKAKPVAKSLAAKTRGQGKKTQKVKSKAYMEDSDDYMEGIEGAQKGKEKHTEAIGELIKFMSIYTVLSKTWQSTPSIQSHPAQLTTRKRLSLHPPRW